jgi:predicted permease
MSWLSRFVNVFRASRVERDLDEELRLHVEARTEALMREGLSRGDAYALARRRLGRPLRLREESRDVKLLTGLDALIQDVRYAGRTLRKGPGFTSVAVLSIALGIGANTAIFTLLDQVLLRLLPVKDPEQLVLVTSRGFWYGDTWGDGSVLSYPLFADLRDHNDVFTGMFCRRNHSLHIGSGEWTERVRGELVSGTYFHVLGVNAHLGRTFSANDDRVPRGQPVAVLSHGYWRTRFASDPAIVGKTIIVSSHPMMVIGVAEEGFDGTNLGEASQVFVPVTMAPLLTPIAGGQALEDRRARWLNVFGRLRPGVTAQGAQAALQPFYTAQLQTEVEQPGFADASSDATARYLKNQIEVRPAGYGKSELRSGLARPLWILMAVVAAVLLIACANVANLLLARATAREREIAVRLALGGSRRRLVQQLVVESLMLAMLGGTLALLLATWGARALLVLFIDPDGTLTVSPSPDLRVLTFTFTVTVATGMLFGLVPALRSTRPALTPILKDEAGSVLGGGHMRLRKVLVIAQVALSFLLLIGAGLFMRSLHNLLTVNPGVETTHLLTFQVDPALNGYKGAGSKQLVTTLHERIRRLPGVTSAGFASEALFTGGSWNSRMTVEGRAGSASSPVVTYNNAISPGYFATMGMTIVAGRDFDERDERHFDADISVREFLDTVTGGVIVNKTFVRQYLSDGPLLGRRLGFGDDPGTPTGMEIVGVVSDAKYRGVRGDVEPQLYFPILGGPGVTEVVMYVRTSQPPEAMLQTLRRAVHEVDANLPLHSMRTVDEQIERSLATERLVAGLSSLFGTLATMLAVVGLYGLMAYTVMRRTREIGIRMALGARAGAVAWMFLREVSLLVAVGILLALPAAWALRRYVESLLYGITVSDPASVVVALALLSSAATVAALMPARRAARVSPMAALRHE